MPIFRDGLIAVTIASSFAIGVAPVGAVVTTHDYTIAGTIDGGGVISGSFALTEDFFVDGSPGHLTVSQADVNVTGTSRYYGQSYVGASPFNNGHQFFEDGTNNVGASIQFLTLFGGGAQLSLNFLYPGGGAIVTTTPSQFNQSYYYNSGGSQSYSVHGLITPVTAGGTVPEPATWLLVIVGFGIVGSALRLSRAAIEGRVTSATALPISTIRTI